MIKLDEDALICDLAETYGIYDYTRLPIYRVAVFACGLKSDARIILKMNNMRVGYEKLLLAGILDRLSLLVYAQTKDAQRGKNRPTMIIENLLNDDSENIEGFTSGEDFEERRREILKNGIGEVR